MDVILISTTDMAADRNHARKRMLQSLVDSQRSLVGTRLILSMLMQRCARRLFEEIAPTLPDFVLPVAIAEQVPLSTARNMLLRQLIADGAIGHDSLVAFPDDDCWYPPGFLGGVAALFTRDGTLDFWFCRYSSHPLLASCGDGEAARVAWVVQNASSNTIFLRGRVVTAIGEFDERLGVGTPLGGGEDVDYALRALRSSRKTTYRDAALVGHRDKSPDIVARYFGSGLVVLARHVRNGAFWQFVRKIAVGIYFVLRRRLALRDFTQALRHAFAERNGSKQRIELGHLDP